MTTAKENNIEGFKELSYNICVVSSMSLVIMMKCEDGIVCGADSRVSVGNNEIFPPIDNIDKIVISDNLIIGTFGMFTVFDKDGNHYMLPNLIRKNISNISNINELAEFIKLYCNGTVKYTMFVGYRDNDNYKLCTLIVNKDGYKILDENRHILYTEPEGIGYKNLVSDKKFCCNDACSSIKIIINSLKNVQEAFSYIPTVGGDLSIKTLR